MSGYLTSSTTGGSCEDSFAAAGQTGKNPPAICGTNTGYHMYVEFGTSSSDTVTLTNTFAALGLATAKNYNILARQICCSDTWKAPTNCVQYFTGISGNVVSYNHQGNLFLTGQDYTNCIRTEKGYCKIQWKEASATSPDPFGIGTILTAAESDVCPTYNSWVSIPNLSPDGVSPIPTAGPNTLAFQTQVCGGNFGIDGSLSAALVSAQTPFTMSVFSTAPQAQTGSGFNLEYTQLAC